MGPQMVPACTLLQNYSLARLCFGGVLDYPLKVPHFCEQHRLRRCGEQLSSVHWPPKQQETNFDTANTEVCKKYNTASSLEVSKARLDGARSNLVWWKMSLLMAGGLEPDDL